MTVFPIQARWKIGEGTHCSWWFSPHFGFSVGGSPPLLVFVGGSFGGSVGIQVQWTQSTFDLSPVFHSLSD